MLIKNNLQEIELDKFRLIGIWKVQVYNPNSSEKNMFYVLSRRLSALQKT